MASIQHVYRRGHVFWWRRVLCIADESSCDIRLSLRTADRRRARELGAMLTAASGDVTMLVEERVRRRADERPSEVELQAIAKAEFQNQLARYCDMQRELPQHRAMHSAANLAYADYYQRMIDTPARQWLYEVKCPAFIDYQDRRDANGRQLPVRGPLGDVPGLRDGTTLPRDNVIKDFLASADRKFRDFSNKPRTGLLVVLWDGYIFEITSALSHAEAGLLTAKSWHQHDGPRVPFDALDGVIVLNHLEVIKVAAQE
ncbi:MAG TPA: hypothetical protein VEW25_05190, partial [Allosphingosinicella sp.]|nr:hypothetical protein [Allosphingosinicella sp.]